MRRVIVNGRGFMGLDTFAPVLQWQPEMKGSLLRVVLPTTEASGQTFVPSAHRVGVGDQHRGVDRRVSFFPLHSILRPTVGIGAKGVITAIQFRNKSMPGKFALERIPHLGLGDVLAVRSGDDSVRANNSDDGSIASSFANGADFSYFVLWLCHLGPPVSLLI